MAEETTFQESEVSELEETLEKTLDYYSILGVSRHATSDEIKKAFKRLAVTFHPDKFPDPDRRMEAQGRFKVLKEAYEILMDENLRGLYDNFGAEAVKKQMNLEIGRPLQSHDDFLREMWRMRRQQHQNYIERKVNHTGGFNMVVNARDEEGKLSPDLVATSIRQGVHFPLDNVSSVRVDFSTFVRGATGDATLKLRYTRAFVGALAAATVGVSAGWQRWGIHLEGTKVLSEKVSSKLRTGYKHGKAPFLDLELARRLGEDWNAGINGRMGAEPALKLFLRSASTSSAWGLNTSLKATASTIDTSVSASYALSERTQLTLEGSWGTEFALGSIEGSPEGKFIPLLLNSLVLRGNLERSISQISRAHVGFSVSTTGVYITVGVTRHGQTFNVPIWLSTVPTLKSSLFGIFVPTMIGYVLESILLEPRRRRKRIAKAAKKKRDQLIAVAAAKQRAVADCRLMADEVSRRREEEENKGGLVIVHAFYGRHPDENVIADINEEEENPYRVDVTLALQYMAQNSAIQISGECNKSALIGFYDPLPDEEKWIEVVYLFRHNIHRVLVGDHEPLRMPLQSHKID